jgi:circadian clock protein KaiC
MRIVSAAAARGENSAVFAFEEDMHIVSRRARTLGEPFEEHIRSGRIAFRHTDAAELSPGEFASIVRRSVEREGTRVVVIDSLNGYLNAMPEEKFLTAQLHELVGFLNNQGVVTILVLALQGLVGSMMTTRLDVSYLTDTVVVFRHFEADGQLHKAISVLKKRTGRHEHAIRELLFDSAGLRVGECLTQFRGILTGVPTYVGEAGGFSRDVL